MPGQHSLPLQCNAYRVSERIASTSKVPVEGAIPLPKTVGTGGVDCYYLALDTIILSRTMPGASKPQKTSRSMPSCVWSFSMRSWASATFAVKANSPSTCRFDISGSDDITVWGLQNWDKASTATLQAVRVCTKAPVLCDRRNIYHTQILLEVEAQNIPVRKLCRRLCNFCHL